MKRETHPMQAKKDLAQRIVADFHSAEAATKAAEDWAKQFQKDEVPENAERVAVSFGEVSKQGDLLLDKLLVRCGLAESGSDAIRKLDQGAVRVGSIVRKARQYRLESNDFPQELLVRVGKRMKIAVVER
jgi:tyrosyl-tRNA synthetase